MPLTIFIIFIILLHILGLEGLYYHLTYYDKFLHLLGGIAVGLIGIKFLKYIHFIYSPFKLIIFSLAMGLLWELHEYLWDLFLRPKFNLPLLQLGKWDTLTDLLCDLVGTLLVVSLIVIKTSKNK